MGHELGHELGHALGHELGMRWALSWAMTRAMSWRRCDVCRALAKATLQRAKAAKVLDRSIAR